MHHSDYIFRLSGTNQDLLHQLSPKYSLRINIGLTTMLKSFRFNPISCRPFIYDHKTDENDTFYLTDSQQANQHSAYTAFLEPKNLRTTISLTINVHYRTP